MADVDCLKAPGGFGRSCAGKLGSVVGHSLAGSPEVMEDGLLDAAIDVMRLRFSPQIWKKEPFERFCKDFRRRPCTGAFPMPLSRVECDQSSAIQHQLLPPKGGPSALQRSRFIHPRRGLCEMGSGGKGLDQRHSAKGTITAPEGEARGGG